MDDPIQVTSLVVDALEALEISYLIGGSLASSAHGISRLTHAADLVADLKIHQAQPLADALKDSFYADVEMIRDAIRHRSCFNVIHLDSMFKVDIYIFRGGEFQKEEFARRQLKVINCNPERTAYIATPEDTILHKLLWYKMGDGVSDRQWMDITGVMKVQGNALDLNYLRHWAGKLKVLEELERALSEVE